MKSYVERGYAFFTSKIGKIYSVRITDGKRLTFIQSFTNKKICEIFINDVIENLENKNIRVERIFSDGINYLQRNMI